MHLFFFFFFFFARAVVFCHDLPRCNKDEAGTPQLPPGQGKSFLSATVKKLRFQFYVIPGLWEKLISAAGNWRVSVSEQACDVQAEEIQAATNWDWPMCRHPIHLQVFALIRVTQFSALRPRS